jgi:anti-anti-sigma regulatory factor
VRVSTCDPAALAGDRLVMLDLSNVTFVDSTALGVRVSFHHRWGERG